MSLDLSSLDQSINDNLAGQTPAAPPSGNRDDSVTLPIVLSPEQAELERLRAENLELKQKQLDTERDQRIKAAVAAANVKDGGPTNGQMAVRRERAIAQCKNKLAQWHQIPIGDRVAILTDGAYVPVKNEELALYFGPNADARETARLKATDSRRYHSYRATAVELGWIG